MGKRRRNERAILPAAQGFSKIRYCRDHSLAVKPVQVFGRKGMMYHCAEGCKLDKTATILRVPDAHNPKRPRR
jgi:hypothetical protein